MRSSYVFALCGDDGAMSYGNNNKNSGGGSGPQELPMVAACNSSAQFSGYKLTLLHGDFVTRL